MFDVNINLMILYGNYPSYLTNFLYEKIRFGKYKGFTYDYIIKNDPKYIIKLSYYYDVPKEVIEWAKENIRFRINQYLPLNGNITELLKRKLEKNKNKAEYIFGDNYSKHEIM